MSILDFFTREAGQERRRALEGLLTQFIPPEIRPQLGLLAEANPVVSMERAGQDAETLFAPDQSLMDRLAAGGRMASNMAGVVAPAVVAGRAGVPVANAVAETMTGLSMSPSAVALRDFGADEFGGVGLPGPADPAIQRAEEVLSLIRAGRADEVTEEMLAMDDPVQYARMSQHLWDNYDLPMDFESRMARRDAMYKSGLYSGTGEDFTAFNDAAAYASTAPDVAFSYAPSDGGSIMPLSMRAQHGSPVVEAGGANWNRLNPSMRADPSTFHIPDDIAPSDAKSFAQWPMSTRDYEMAAKREGFSGITFNDIVDVGGYMSKARPPVGTPEFEEIIRYLNNVSKPSTVEARFYPNQIRSAFARFDPRLAHLRNLNAALAAGVPLGLLAMQPEEEQY